MNRRELLALMATGLMAPVDQIFAESSHSLTLICWNELNGEECKFDNCRFVDSLSETPSPTRDLYLLINKNLKESLHVVGGFSQMRDFLPKYILPVLSESKSRLLPYFIIRTSRGEETFSFKAFSFGTENFELLLKNEETGKLLLMNFTN